MGPLLSTRVHDSQESARNFKLYASVRAACAPVTYATHLVRVFCVFVYVYVRVRVRVRVCVCVCVCAHTHTHTHTHTHYYFALARDVVQVVCASFAQHTGDQRVETPCYAQVVHIKKSFQ